MKVNDVWAAVAEYGSKMGVKDISKLPGCWEHQVDKHWWIAFNGHNDEREATSPTSCKHNVPAFCVYIEFNGWPAGIIGRDGGEMCAGALANSETFLAALKEPIPAAGEEG